MIKALVTVDSTPSHWGDADQTDAAVIERAAEILAERIADAIVERYPEAEVEYHAHDYRDGESTRLVDLSGDYTIEQYDTITALVGLVSEDGWEQALYDATVEARNGESRT
jgi:hypothetical protein